MSIRRRKSWEVGIGHIPLTTALTRSTARMTSVLWRCWLGVRKSMRPVKTDWWGVGVVICLERGADCLHMVQLMPLLSPNPIISCLIEIQTGFTFLVLAYPGCPGTEAVKRVCVDVLLNIIVIINRLPRYAKYKMQQVVIDVSWSVCVC